MCMNRGNGKSLAELKPGLVTVVLMFIIYTTCTDV